MHTNETLKSDSGEASAWGQVKAGEMRNEEECVRRGLPRFVAERENGEGFRRVGGEEHGDGR